MKRLNWTNEVGASRHATTYTQKADQQRRLLTIAPMTKDPFLIRRLPKYHPTRIAFTAYGRLVEIACALRFDSYAIAEKVPDGLPMGEYAENQPDTAVTAAQMRYLAAALEATESMNHTSIVEVGCYRGVTTRFLAQRTKRMLFAVDPFFGYGGSDHDLAIFRMNIQGIENITPVRSTSGEAARSWDKPEASFVFIDAVHDYVNVAHDIEAWEARLSPGGILALHDTDNRTFSGARYAAFKAAHSPFRFHLYAHTNNLTILRKTSVATSAAARTQECAPR